MTYKDPCTEAREAYEALKIPRMLEWRTGKRHWPITTDEIMYLNALCARHIDEIGLSTIRIFMRDPDIVYDGGFIEAAFLRVDGGRFDGTEAISFNRDGSIEFCGWSNSANERPFTDAFMEWCEWMRRTHVRQGMPR